MEKEIGKIKKNEITDIVIRIDDFGGKVGLTIREYVTGDRYTGFTKAGTRIPAENFLAFRELINSINLEDLEQEKETKKAEEAKEGEVTKETKPKRGRKKKEKVAEKEEAKEESEEQEILGETSEENE